MSILEKLLEKKDLDIYLVTRWNALKRMADAEIRKAPVKNRQLVRGRFEGRMLELKMLRKLLKQNLIKDVAKKNWRPEGEDF